MFGDKSEAQEAMEAMHGYSMPPNKQLHVEPALATTNPRNVTPGPRLYMKHVPQETTTEELQQMLEVFGTVKECEVLTDSTAQSRGLALVEMGSKAQADAVVKPRHSTSILICCGALISVVICRSETLMVTSCKTQDRL